MLQADKIPFRCRSDSGAEKADTGDTYKEFVKNAGARKFRHNSCKGENDPQSGMIVGARPAKGRAGATLDSKGQ
jgi:hypothetical protein